MIIDTTVDMEESQGEEDEAMLWRAEVAGAYLGDLRHAGKRLRRKLAEIREQRSLLDGLKGNDPSRPYVKVSVDKDAVARARERVAEMEEDYSRDLADLDERRAEARACLNRMGGDDADLLRLFYVSALPWSCVAEAMNLAEGTCKNKKRPALAEFYGYMPHHARPPEEHAI